MSARICICIQGSPYADESTVATIVDPDLNSVLQGTGDPLGVRDLLLPDELRYIASTRWHNEESLEVLDAHRVGRIFATLYCRLVAQNQQRDERTAESIKTSIGGAILVCELAKRNDSGVHIGLW